MENTSGGGGGGEEKGAATLRHRGTSLSSPDSLSSSNTPSGTEIPVVVVAAAAAAAAPPFFLLAHRYADRARQWWALVGMLLWLVLRNGVHRGAVLLAGVRNVLLDGFRNETFNVRDYEDPLGWKRIFYLLCCCGCSPKYFCTFLLALSLLSFVAMPGRPSEAELQLDSTLHPLPLVHTMLDTACFPVPPDVARQTFRSGIAFSEFVRSMRAHLLTQKIIGITSFHVGLPLCLLAYVDDERHTIRVLANPVLVGQPVQREQDTQVIRETDLLCPAVGVVERHRHTHIVLEYQEMDTKGRFLHFRKNSTDAPLVLKEVLKGAPAFILQHLMDTLTRKSMCIPKKS
jgi:peptide deformylase